MKNLVLLEVPFQAVAFVTVLALKRPLTAMHQQVGLKALLRTVCFTTLCACVRLLILMCESVFLQMAQLKEALVTLVAFVLPLSDNKVSKIPLSLLCAGVLISIQRLHRVVFVIRELLLAA